MMMNKEQRIKEAQGKKSREIGKANLMKLLTHLHYHPSTFTQLERLGLFSKPVLMKHLRNLRKQGLIQKRLENDNIIYYTTPKALDKSITYIVNLIKDIPPEDFEYALNFMTNTITYLIAETQKMINRQLKKEPQNEKLKDILNKLQSSKEELLPWLKEL